MLSTSRRSVRRSAGLAAFLATAVAVAGCSATPTPSDDDAASDENVTLRIAFSSLPDMVDALADAFHEEHPNITIEPEYTAFADYVTSIRLSMSSDTAPDLAQFAVPSKDLVEAGELLALDDYADENGWYETFPESALGQLELSENGKTFGTGSLYGVPVALSMTGVYYNKAIAEEIGAPVVWTTAALLGQHPMTQEQADRVCRLLDLDSSVAESLQRQPMRGSDPEVLSDPTIYRFVEALKVYGPALKELIHEKFGDGIMSAINFRVDVSRREDPDGDRVVVTFDGKFLDYRW